MGDVQELLFIDPSLTLHPQGASPGFAAGIKAFIYSGKKRKSFHDDHRINLLITCAIKHRTLSVFADD